MLQLVRCRLLQPPSSELGRSHTCTSSDTEQMCYPDLLVHSVQGIEAARYILYVSHCSVIVAHHFLHQIGVASDLHALLNKSQVTREKTASKQEPDESTPGLALSGQLRDWTP